MPRARAAEVTGAVHLQGEDVADLSPALRAGNFGAALARPEAQLFLATARNELVGADSVRSASHPHWHPHRGPVSKWNTPHSSVVTARFFCHLFH